MSCNCRKGLNDDELINCEEEVYQNINYAYGCTLKEPCFLEDEVHRVLLNYFAMREKGTIPTAKVLLESKEREIYLDKLKMYSSVETAYISDILEEYIIASEKGHCPESIKNSSSGAYVKWVIIAGLGLIIYYYYKNPEKLTNHFKSSKNLIKNIKRKKSHV